MKHKFVMYIEGKGKGGRGKRQPITAVYLTLFKVTCFGSFYKTIIRLEEILKKKSPCTKRDLH